MLLTRFLLYLYRRSPFDFNIMTYSSFPPRPTINHSWPQTRTTTLAVWGAACDVLVQTSRVVGQSRTTNKRVVRQNSLFRVHLLLLRLSPSPPPRPPSFCRKGWTHPRGSSSYKYTPGLVTISDALLPWCCTHFDAGLIAILVSLRMKSSGSFSKANDLFHSVAVQEMFAMMSRRMRFFVFRRYEGRLFAFWVGGGLFLFVCPLTCRVACQSIDRCASIEQTNETSRESRI